MKLSLLLILIILIPARAFSGEAFAPWNADVDCGDALNNRPHVCTSKHSCKMHIKKKHVQPVKHYVFNGPQGGSYILIRFFQVVISPQDGPNCRFRPTCSQYGRQAVERFGALLGAILIGDRLLRCNPYSKPGHDPLPESICGD